MEVFGTDFIFKDFRASDYDLDMCSFEYDGDSDDDMFEVETKETFISDNPFAVYQGQSYNFKLEAQVTLMKSPCKFNKQSQLNMTEYEWRALMRQLSGWRGYQWMKFITADIGEDIWYKARVKNIKAKRANGMICGMVLAIETDSYMGYSKEYNQTFNMQKDVELKFYSNSDDLQNYLYPYVTILPQKAGSLTITNLSDISTTYPHGYDITFGNVVTSDVLVLDGKHQIVKGQRLDDFNGHWIRLLPGENRLISNLDIKLQLKYRFPRKVGFVCR